MNFLASGKVLWLTPGEGIGAEGVIPQDAEFFQDHFPDFPVLPGVLALEILKQTAEAYLRQTDSHCVSVSIEKVGAVKFSVFLKPGDPWQSRLELVSDTDGHSEWRGFLLRGEDTAVSARMTLRLAA